MTGPIPALLWQRAQEGTALRHAVARAVGKGADTDAALLLVELARLSVGREVTGTPDPPGYCAAGHRYCPTCAIGDAVTSALASAHSLGASQEAQLAHYRDAMARLKVALGLPAEAGLGDLVEAVERMRRRIGVT